MYKLLLILILSASDFTYLWLNYVKWIVSPERKFLIVWRVDDTCSFKTTVDLILLLKSDDTGWKNWIKVIRNIHQIACIYTSIVIER